MKKTIVYFSYFLCCSLYHFFRESLHLCTLRIFTEVDVVIFWSRIHSRLVFERHFTSTGIRDRQEQGISSLTFGRIAGVCLQHSSSQSGHIDPHQVIGGNNPARLVGTIEIKPPCTAFVNSSNPDAGDSPRSDFVEHYFLDTACYRIYPLDSKPIAVGKPTGRIG